MENKDLREAGLKVTGPRVTILKVLEKHAHMSAEDVYNTLLQQGEDIGLATVYRVLTQFEEAGLVKRHQFETGHSVFEIEQGGHHDHLVCLRCGKVIEFMDEIIEAQQEKIAKKHGFIIKDHKHNLYGFCQKCQIQKN